MLSEYELINVISSNQYTRVSSEKSTTDWCFGDIHIVDEEGTKERNYIRPNHIRNAFDYFMDGFDKREDNKCMSDADHPDHQIQWKTHIDVLEDVLTLGARISSLSLYTTSKDEYRVNGTSQIHIGILLPPSSLSLITQLAMWSIGGTPILLSPSLSIHQINIILNQYSIKTLVTTNEMAMILLEHMRMDPTIMPSLAAIILSYPHLDEHSQRTAELFHIALYATHDLLNPAITLTPLNPHPSLIKTLTKDCRLPLPAINTPSETTHRRKLRLIRQDPSHREDIRSKDKRKSTSHAVKPQERHKASVDDYDKEKHKSKKQQNHLLFPFITYDPGLLDIAVIMVTFSQTQRMTMVRRSHLQLLAQCDLWSQRVFSPSLSKPDHYVLLADRPSCSIEQLLLELMVLHQGGRICYLSIPCEKHHILPIIRPTIILVDNVECEAICDSITHDIHTLVGSQQQHLWKCYIGNRDHVVTTSILPTIKQNRSFQRIVVQHGLDCLKLVIDTGVITPPSITLFLRTVLSCSVVNCFVCQELGSVLFSTRWNDHNSFGHVGAPLMGMAVRLKSAPEVQLQITDSMHLRGVCTEDDIVEELENKVVFVKGSFYQGKTVYNGKEKVLLCSSCEGRGEVWVKGLCFSHGYSCQQDLWVNTEYYGLWREDGAMEILTA